MAKGLTADELARRVGVEANSYQKMEDTGRWRGNERQSAALAALLGLTLAQFVTATGKQEELAELLRSAVTTRWQAYVKPVGKLLPIPKGHLERVLDQLHGEYQSRMVATLSWGGGEGEAGRGDSGRDFLAEIVDRFWRLAGGAA